MFLSFFTARFFQLTHPFHAPDSQSGPNHTIHWSALVYDETSLLRLFLFGILLLYLVTIRYNFGMPWSNSDKHILDTSASPVKAK